MLTLHLKYYNINNSQLVIKCTYPYIVNSFSTNSITGHIGSLKRADINSHRKHVLLTCCFSFSLDILPAVQLSILVPRE